MAKIRLREPGFGERKLQLGSLSLYYPLQIVAGAFSYQGDVRKSAVSGTAVVCTALSKN